MAAPSIAAASVPQRIQARRWRVNWTLVIGLVMVLGPTLLGLAAPMLVDRQGLRLGTFDPLLIPSAHHLLGTDPTGRDIFAMVAYGTPTTLEIGLIAGGVGTVVGTLLGLISGYYRGPLDTVLRLAADIALGIPSLAILVVIAAVVGSTSLETMALIIAAFAWPAPTRAVRAQVLSLREQGYVSMSKLSGRNDGEIIVLEILPNLLPYVMAGFVGAVSGGILASVGLQLLGLGQLGTVTLGLILQAAFQTAALSRGLWWWWTPPTVMLMLLFMGLFLISIALDEIANPRLKGLNS